MPDKTLRPHPALKVMNGLILTQYVMTVRKQRISDVTHHAAFWGKTVPVQHPALEQTWR